MPHESAVSFYRWSEVSLESVTPKMDRKLISCDRVMLAKVFLKKDYLVPRHQHEEEQVTYILEGGLRFWIGEDESEVLDVIADEVLHIPSNVPHKALALTDSVVVDVFSPPRQDWLNKSDAYLREGTR